MAGKRSAGLLQAPGWGVAEPGCRARSATLRFTLCAHTHSGLACAHGCGSLFLLGRRGPMFTSLAAMVRSLSSSETCIKSLTVHGLEQSTELLCTQKHLSKVHRQGLCPLGTEGPQLVKMACDLKSPGCGCHSLRLVSFSPVPDVSHSTSQYRCVPADKGLCAWVGGSSQIHPHF